MPKSRATGVSRFAGAKHCIIGILLEISATVSHPLPKGFDIFFQGDNLTNDQYNIAKTPVPNLGQPILARIGFRWQSRR